ncbi:MAG: hypothetical protein FJ083_13895 [Cyanobacteria bacterium K_Offshore_surface_m2_239]|nr:hypothetical protein [Cyanobacteria bacterium K_Offshore_surface_m2_239]
MPPYSYVQRPLSSGATQTVPFPFLARDHVKLFRNYDLTTGAFEQLLVQGVDYTWINNVSINISPGLSGILTILRATPTTERIVDWANGSMLTAEPLDTADLQVFYAFQEVVDRAAITGLAAAEALATTSYSLTVEDVASIPANPVVGLRLEVRNSTGIEGLAIAGMPSGFLGSPSLRVRIRRTAAGWVWDDYRPDDPDARYRVRRGQSSATLSVAAGATAVGSISLPRSCQLISITASEPSWIRVYSSQAAASADASRQRGQAPALGAGVICDPVLLAQAVSFEPSPCAINREASNTYPIRVTNDGTTGGLVATIQYLLLEP